MTTFNDLGLAEPLLRALKAEGYDTPTPIQAQAIPTVMTGRDLLGIAQTGTGKTAAFALPILHRLANDRRQAPPKGCRVLVLSPTRELATQIAVSFKTYGKHMGVRVGIVFGGVGYRPQIETMARGVDVLVATPGRLLDHMGDRAINLGHTEMFVLDEADQMLDLGFLKPIKQVVAQLPKQRQNLFFSATMPTEIGALAGELLKDPAKVSVAPAGRTVDRIEQKVILVEHAKKRSLLVELLNDEAMSRTLVFARTKRGADRVAEYLSEAGINASAIHGNKSQGQRERALSEFKADKVKVLVATDIAARGIDIDQVSHVVNFELPDVPESYVHRIGRTARAGASGTAITLCSIEERGLLKDIERLTRQTIPTEDRRSDTSLDADAQPLSTRSDDRRRMQDRQGRGGAGRRTAGAGGGTGGGNRRGAGAPAGAGRASHAGEDRPDFGRTRTDTSARPHGGSAARAAGPRDTSGATARAEGPDGRAGRPSRGPNRGPNRSPNHGEGPRSESRSSSRPEGRQDARRDSRPAGASAVPRESGAAPGRSRPDAAHAAGTAGRRPPGRDAVGDGGQRPAEAPARDRGPRDRGASSRTSSHRSGAAAGRPVPASADGRSLPTWARRGTDAR